jgi:hypothetical protein
MTDATKAKVFTYMLGEMGGEWDVDLPSRVREEGFKSPLRARLFRLFEVISGLARSGPVVPPVAWEPGPVPGWEKEGLEIPHGMPPTDSWIDDLNAVFALAVVADKAVVDKAGKKLDYETFKALVKCGEKFPVEQGKVDQLMDVGLEPDLGELLPEAMKNGVPFFDLHQRQGIRCCMYFCNEWYSCFSAPIMIKWIPGDPAIPWKIRVDSDIPSHDMPSKDIPMFLQVTWHCLDQGPLAAERGQRRDLVKWIHGLDLKTFGEHEPRIRKALQGIPGAGN